MKIDEEMLSLEQKAELRLRKEHREAIESIKAILGTSFGKAFIKYLFKSFDVGEMPEVGSIQNDYLMERLGFLRAGNSIFKIVAEAHPEQAGLILAQIEREKYELKMEEYLAGQSR